MKLFVIFGWALFIYCALFMTSCKKVLIQDEPILLGNVDLDVLNNHFLVPENQYIMTDYYDDYENLYHLMPEWNKDDHFNWDIKTKTGWVAAMDVQDPYERFDTIHKDIKTYADTSGVWLQWMDVLYQPMNLHLESYNVTGCWFVVSYNIYGMNYYIRYDKLIL